jgi:hypothetical protein
MTKHLMIDFETYALTPDALVLSLGAVLFTREGISKAYQWFFSMSEQMENRRVIDPDTVDWWSKQSNTAKETIKKSKQSDASIIQQLKAFSSFISQDTRVWANPSSFDIPIAEHLFHQYELSIPWKYYNFRCYNTFKQMFDIAKNKPFTGVKHNALYDAIYQANNVIDWLKENPQYDK